MTNNHGTPSDPNQLSFMSALPPEIIPLIFVHITQRDCLNSMAVCRAWYNAVPQYTRHVWEHVRISQRDVHMVHNRRRERCLGKHVKKVMFQHLPDEEQLYDAMRGLYKCNCTNIETIGFIRCATANQDVFIPLLRQLAARVTRIELLRHRTNVSFLHLLNACPSLTHFSFNATTDSYDNHGVYDKEPKLHERISLRDQFPNIVYLRFNSIMDERRRVEPVLMRCPNLRFFIGAEYGTHVGAAYLGIGTNPVYVQLDKLLSWCPKIAHIQTSSAFGYFSTTAQHRISDSAYSIGKNHMTDGDHCLRQLATSSNYGLDQITRLLKANQQTLGYVSLGNHRESFNWSPTLRSLSLTQVHTLAFYDLKFDAASLIILLNNSPMIATLVIRDTRLIFDHHSFGLFGPMNHLRTLELTDVVFGDDHAIGIFIDRLPALEELHIISSVIPLAFFASTRELKRVHLSDIQWTIPNTTSSYNEALLQIFPESLPERSTKLEVLRTRSRSITYDLLQQVVNSKSLQEIHAQLDHTLCDDDDTGFCRLANVLKETPIGILQLDNIRSLTFAALEALSNIPQLARFTTKCILRADNNSIITRVDKSGLMQLVCKSAGLRHIRLSNVILVENGNTVDHGKVVKEIQQRFSCYASCYDGHGPRLTHNGEAKNILIQRTKSI